MSSPVANLIQPCLSQCCCHDTSNNEHLPLTMDLEFVPSHFFFLERMFIYIQCIFPLPYLPTLSLPSFLLSFLPLSLFLPPLFLIPVSQHTSSFRYTSQWFNTHIQHLYTTFCPPTSSLWIFFSHFFLIFHHDFFPSKVYLFIFFLRFLTFNVMAWGGEAFGR